jgi:hypothetical protein
LQRLLHRRQRQAEGRQFDVGQFDPDFLVLQTEQVDLADILDPLQLDLDAVGVILEHRVIETIAGQRIDIAERGTELIVEKRPLNVRRQGLANIADLLAHLIPEVRDFLGVHRVAGNERHLRFTGTRERHDALVLAGFHQFLFDAFGDLPRDFLRGRPRPTGLNHHGFERERRVFALAEFGVGQRTDDGQQEASGTVRSGDYAAPIRKG